MNKRRRLPLLAALVTLGLIVAAFAASSAFADGTINWNPKKQGTTDGVLNQSKCGDAADFAGMTLPPGADANNYFVWVLSPVDSDTLTSATLSTNGDLTVWPTSTATKDQGDNIKFLTKAYDISTLTAFVNYVGTIDGTPDLKISHGCGG